jgi:hypothetical protein
MKHGMAAPNDFYVVHIVHVQGGPVHDIPSKVAGMVDAPSVDLYDHATFVETPDGDLVARTRHEGIGALHVNTPDFGEHIRQGSDFAGFFEFIYINDRFFRGDFHSWLGCHNGYLPYIDWFF